MRRMICAPRGLDYDWLLSVANLSIIPQPLLDGARRGAVNFHDGPLPRHAGLNAPPGRSWGPSRATASPGT